MEKSNSSLDRQLYVRLLCLILLLCAIVESSAQVRVPFQQRASEHTPTKLVYHVKGDFTMLGNTNLTLQNYGSTTQNGYNSMVYVDVDAPTLTGLGGTPTVNSSSATLQFSTQNGAVPECSTVIFAGLYWTGRAHNVAPSQNTFDVTVNGVTKNLNKHKVQLKGPAAAAYTEFTSPPHHIYYPTNADDFMYSAYVEITDYVRANGLGEYTVADIALLPGNGGGTGYYGGWGMVVVYENSQLRYRDITIFDGHAFVPAGQASYDIPVSGFNTLQTGTVGVKLGMIAGEGDSGIAGDYFKIQKLNSTTFQDLEHPLNAASNFFNSSIITGNNPRNPDLLNNTGLDISMFDIPNPNNSVIGNNQTSTKFRYGSTGDTYIIFAVALAVDAYVPDVEGILSLESINGSSVVTAPFEAEPNQTLKYKVQVKNKGTEAVKNASVVIPLPFNANYVANSAQGIIHFTPYSGANSAQVEQGSLVWNIGNLPTSSNPDAILAELTFELRVSDNCAMLTASSCSNSISITGAINGIGALTNVAIVEVPLIRGYMSNGICAGIGVTGPIMVEINSATFVNQNCNNSQPLTFTFCQTTGSISVDQLSNSFPIGTSFYSSFPVVSGQTIQYSSSNPFPVTATPTTFYAVPPAAHGCFYEFVISGESATSSPTPNHVTYWINATATTLTATLTNPSYNLYYFTSEDADPQITITPSTAAIGQTTYYVAEGSSTDCLGPLVPLIVTVVAPEGFTAPANANFTGCGIQPIAPLSYSGVSVIISVADFLNAGGTIPSGENQCELTIQYVDSTSGSCPIVVTRTFTITDACNLNISVIQQITINSGAPIFAGVPTSQTIECGTEVEFAEVSLTDACNATITFEDNVLQDACSGSHSITRTWIAVNNCGQSSSIFQTINVVDTQMPTLQTEAQNLILKCDSFSSDALEQWLQNNGGAIATDLCSEITWSNNYDDTQLNCSVPIQVIFTATDACGNLISTSATITITDNTPPITPEAPASITVQCLSEVPLPPTLIAVDNCQGNISATGQDVTTQGNCASSFSIVRNWTFVDSCGNQSQIFQNIIVQDTTGPQLISPLQTSLSVTCDAIPEKPDLQFVDGCGSPIIADFTETVGSHVNNTYVIVRHWTVSDACDNQSVFTQTIAVTDSVQHSTAKGYAACNSDVSLTIDLKSLLHEGVSTQGSFTELTPSGAVNGSIFTPNGLQKGEYIIFYEVVTSNCPQLVEITITVDDDCLVLPSCSLVVHNAITPNNDGANDVFYIENIDDTNCFPTNTVEIYNRWGALVYETSQYNNSDRSFKGFSEGKTTVNKAEELPTGTYFYILRYTNTQRDTVTKDGYLYLSR